MLAFAITSRLIINTPASLFYAVWNTQTILFAWSLLLVMVLISDDVKYQDNYRDMEQA